jgi:anti-sigma B factor antagonist
MEMDFHRDPLVREELILRYLERGLAAEVAEEWEGHYLGCAGCFEEMRATELLIRAIGMTGLERGRVEDVTVLRFAEGTQLLAASLELSELARVVRTPNESRVLIDLSRVSRIDSSGLGVLMSCYCHAIKNAGALKLLNPEPRVRQVLNIAGFDAVLETFEDEAAAIDSFRPAAPRP